MWGGIAFAGLGRWGRVDRGLRWPALGWAAVLIWKLARMDFLTIRASGKRYVLVAIANHPSAEAARAVFDALLDWTVRDR